MAALPTSGSAISTSRMSGRVRCLLTGLALYAALSGYGWCDVADQGRSTAIDPVASNGARTWGTFLRPFAADSPWNSRPVRPRFGEFVVPKSSYVPAIAEGVWSDAIFLASKSDSPMVVKGPAGSGGVWDPDEERLREVIIPRWPGNVAPAAAADGHADIYDPESNAVHSFWQLKKVDGQWTAALYAWSRIDGRGWGDPAHYYQGPRAAAVPASAGIIRRHEVNDGDTMYRHALAMSLTFNGLSAAPTYIYPATSADANAATSNTGAIPEGALMMLPPSFDVQKLSSPELRKVAETLKVYGAYVVDRNVGTPYFIYVEIGSGFDLHKSGWNQGAAVEMDQIREAMRQVIETDGWIDGNGKSSQAARSLDLNLLSMRGPWSLTSGDAAGVFDSLTQSVVFPSSQKRVQQRNDSGKGMRPVTWAQPVAGRKYRLTVMATGGAKLRIALRAKGGSAAFDSRDLANGESVSFEWPADGALVAYLTSGLGEPSSVRGELIAVPQ